jgi:hypothetical protein
MGIDFSQYDFSGIGSGAGSSGGGSQTMSNAELYAQYQSTGYIPDDNPIDTTTTFNTSSDGSVVVWNPSSGAGGFLGSDGSSMQAVGGVVVSSSAANPAPLVIGGKTYNPEDSFSYQAAGGVEVNCTAAATAAGYGRTCTSSNIDGSVTTTSAAGMIGLNAQGEIFGTGGEEGIGGRGISNGNTGPIDHGDCGQGSQNVACAAIKFATGQLSIDEISAQYDAPRSGETWESCMQRVNSSPTTAGIYSSAEQCGFGQGSVSGLGPSGIDLGAGFEGLSAWWQKYGKWVSTATAVIGFAICVAGTAGACAAFAYGAFAVSTAGNVTMFAAGDKSGWNTIGAIALDVPGILIPGVAAAKAQFVEKNLPALTTRLAQTGVFRGAVAKAGFTVKSIAFAQLPAMGAQAGIATRSVACALSGARNYACP